MSTKTDIAELKQQVVALQTALSLVLSPEHRKIVDSKDLRKTLKELTKQDESDAIMELMMEQRHRQLAVETQMRMAQLSRAQHSARSAAIGGTDPFLDLNFKKS